MRRYDDETAYPMWCVFFGHRWWRPFYPANYATSWQRDRSCHRCEHILMGTAAVEERWRRINAAAKAEGCKCGKPATTVRRYGGTTGSVPSEVWSCEEHRNVNEWSGSGSDGPWTPRGDVTPEIEAWRVG